jgi:hypothetical protein
MFKRSRGVDERSQQLRETIQEDDNLTPKQKRRLLNSLLSTAVLSVDELNELEIHSDEESEEILSEEESGESSSTEEGEIFSEGNFRLCRHCPGKKMLTEDDVRKHLESKTHNKRKLKQLAL